MLTGAGCSTESGIPDYRGPETRRRARNPIQFDDFVKDPVMQARYWSRSAVGWQRVAAAQPNPAHQALARWEDAGQVVGIITQNVDGLHQAAGSRRVVELHGSLATVRCLACGAREARAALQGRIQAMNPNWEARPRELAPDGDAELIIESEAPFQVPVCLRCGGALKPDVVFFGENVPKERVTGAWALYEEADVLLVVGSSLAVYSGYRFVLRGRKEGRAMGLVNLGPTRGDAFMQVRVEAAAGAVLPKVVQQLGMG